MIDPAGSRSRALIVDISLIALMAGIFFASLAGIDWLTEKHLAWAYFKALLLVFVPLGLFALLERILPPAGPRKSLRHSLLHLRISIFIHYASTIAAAFLVTSATVALSQHFNLGLIDLRFSAASSFVVLLGTAVAVMFVHDFFFYWWHRLQHKSAVFWQIHKVHHTDPALDVLTDGRQNWVDQFPRSLFIFIPMAILFKFNDIDPLQAGLAGGAVICLQAIQRSIQHCNVRWHYGWATPLICGPQVHRIHHSRLEHHRDKNFAAFVPLWDILFGTYYAPARDEFPPTGVAGEEKEFASFFESQTVTLRDWWRMFDAWRHRRSRGAATSGG